MENKYIRLCDGLNDKGELIPVSEFNNDLTANSDFYSSIYYYNEEHYKQFQKTGTVVKIKDVTTDRLVFDFDSKDDLQQSKQDTLSLCNKLFKQNINSEVYFSGGKGFTVIINLDKEITPEKAQELSTEVFGKDLKTLDPGIYNASRILRLPNTKHNKTGLYKVALTYEQLSMKTIDEIKEYAKEPKQRFPSKKVTLDPNLLIEKPKKIVEIVKKEFNIRDIDWTKKPRHWKDYRWAIAQGYFKSGNRHEALMVLAATCRGLGYDKEQTFYLCKAAIKKQAALCGQAEFEKEELWNNIIESSIFGDHWEGGQYSPENNAWLKKYCSENNFKWDREEEKPIISLDDMSKKFTDYAVNFEKNILKTGLQSLDDNVMLLASNLVGLLGQPGSSKTSQAMKILKYNSQQGIQSTFFSMDMGLPMIYAKLIQNLKGYSFKKVMDIYKNNPKQAQDLIDEVKKVYKNVGFNFKSGLNVADMKEVIKKQEEMTGNPTKLVVVDYLECVASDFSDPTVGGGKVATQLKDLANELNICVLLLLQTQKHSTPNVSDPLLSMKQVKGSSLLEQSMSVILTLWREGYDAKTVKDDKYVSFACVKNRFGPLWSDDFSWDGVTGETRELNSLERDDLRIFREEKEAAKQEQNKDWQN
jgi:hypothetical protein